MISKFDSENALKTITSTISRCEKAQLKFKPGCSQHSLLRNRLNALYISKALLTHQDISNIQDDELIKALSPITSIISKCEKAQQKYDVDNAQYKRYIHLLNAMNLCQSLISEEINKRCITK